MMNFPSTLSILCKHCGNEAVYDGDLIRKLNPDEDEQYLTTVKYSGSVYVVKYPDLYTWKDIDGKNKKFGGVVLCHNCHARYAHQLSWPDDAFYQVTISNQCLWGFDRAHFLSIRDFIQSLKRDPSNYNCEYYLRHLPKFFLLAKNRAAITKKINTFLRIK